MQNKNKQKEIFFFDQRLKKIKLKQFILSLAGHSFMRVYVQGNE